MKLFAHALAVLLLVSCKTSEEKTKPTIEKITESVYASGVVKSRKQYQVFSSVSGLIKEVYVNEGDLVKKGDPLFRLSDLTAALNIENARIAAEYGSVAANADKLNEVKIEIENARAKMENDASLVERQRNLWSQGIGTKNELDQRELIYKNSSNSFSAAKLHYRQLEKQLNLQAKQTQKAVEIYSSTKGDFTIRSEFNGKVYSVIKKQGEMATPQVALALIGEADAFTLELQVDEYDIARIRQGQKILLTMDSYKDKNFTAVVEKINPAMNSLSKSFTIDAGFVIPPPVLYPNLTTEANIIIRVKDSALTIPRSYLTADDYVILENKERRKVTTGLKDYRKVEIRSGLTPNDVIIKPAE
ncbi:MAG TPA: efflux RND transporter periplasmic adaptor subunit [Sediminibacterium sp.]|nr:efflux RND transporter periplasmic adaptor subunit [Sediminibacterium sp.]